MIHTHLIHKWSARHHAWKGLAVIILLAMSSSCGKQREYAGNPAMLEVFNAVDDGVGLYVNLTGMHPITYNGILSINSKRGTRISISEKEQSLAFYALGDTLPADKPVWRDNINLEMGKMYILYLYGEKKSVEHMIVEETYPAPKTGDSVTNVRIGNMSKGQQLSVNLKGNPPGSLVNNLDFKATTGFMALKADKSVSVYEFEFRDAVTGNLLGTYKATDIGSYQYGINTYLNVSWTLYLAGKPGGSGVNAHQIVKIIH